MRASKDIMWTVKFRNGSVKRFKFPIRTTDEGAAVPDGGFETASDLNDHMLMSQPASIGTGKMWTK
jgi:adenylylsulfate reductase subunit B